MEVALKTLPEHSPDYAVKRFFDEIAIHEEIMPHPNIIGFERR
jgi:hypothetical protein